MSALVDPVILGKSIKSWKPAEIQAEELLSAPLKPTGANQKQQWQEIDFSACPAEPAWEPVEFAAQEQEDGQDTLPKMREEEAAASGARSWQPQLLEPTSDFDLAVGSMPPFGSQETQRSTLPYLQEAQKKAAELLRQAEMHSGRIIKQAEAQAAELIRQAEDQAARVTQRAYAEGVSAAQAETEDQLRTATSIVEEVNVWREGQLSQAEMMILRLVIEIAQSIFGEGLPLDPETLGQSFSRALAQAKTLGNLRVYVNPEDAAVLSPYWTQKQMALSGQQIELIPSDIIKRGGCFVEGQYGAVDARVESQFQLVKETLLSTWAASKNNDQGIGD